MNGLRIVADYDLCQGHAECMVEAPGVFDVPSDGQVVILNQTPGDELLDAVRNAVRYCPTHALRIEED